MMFKCFKYYGIYWVYSFTLLLLLSPDSFLYDIYEKCDTSMFFVDGKAWMNGMVPYRDFYDTKGPLLFLFYGTGYLVSHYNYLGVFILSVFWYGLIFLFSHKIAKLFLHDDKRTVLSALLMGGAFFNPLIHWEFRAEDICCLFTVIALYRTCRILYADYDNAEREFKHGLFIIGICFAGSLMVKFSLAIMLLIFIFYICYFAYLYHLVLYRLGYSFLLGTLVVVAPFLVFFLIEGNLVEFINGYFVQTLEAAWNSDASDGTQFLSKLFFSVGLVTFFVSVFSTVSMALLLKRHREFPLVCFLFFYILSLPRGTWPYYYTSCSVFALFGIIAIIHVATKLQVVRLAFSCVCVMYLISHIYMYYNWPHHNFYTHNGDERIAYYSHAFLMCQVNNPRIVCFDADWGYGLLANSLPACKYWCLQVGETAEMMRNKWRCVRNRIPDFVMVPKVEEQKYKELPRLGYLKYSPIGSRSVMFYKHKDLKLPPEGFHITNRDVLTKRKIINSIFKR